MQRGDAQIELAGGVGRARRDTGHDLTQVAGARCSADQIDLQVQVGDVLLLDGHLQGHRVLVDAEALGVEQAAAADGQQPLGGAKRGLHQDLGQVARLVALAIRDQGGGLQLDLARWRARAAAHPAGELTLVLAAECVGDRRGDLVFAPHLRVKGAGYRLQKRPHGAFLDVDRLLAPVATYVFPFEAGGLDLDGTVRLGKAIQIGDD